MIFHFRPIPRKTKKRVFSRLCRIGKRCVFTDEGRDTKRGGAQTLRLDTPSPVKSLCEKDYQERDDPGDVDHLNGVDGEPLRGGHDLVLVVNRVLRPPGSAAPSREESVEEPVPGLFIGGAPIRIPTRFGLDGAHEVTEPAGVNGGVLTRLGGRARVIG